MLNYITRTLLSSILLGTILMTNTKADIPNIRIRIAKSLSNLKVSGLDLKKRLFHSKSTKVFPGKMQISFDCDEVLKKITTLSRSTPLASLSSQTGLINWKKEKYRGELIISTSSDKKGCDLINEINMENYISSLLAKEMEPKWPIEALKAQAVAARTYAYHRKMSKHVNRKYGFNAQFDLENSELYQVNGSFSDETVTTLMASNSTKGEVLVAPKGEITPIFFHSKCGGKTMLPEDVWENKVSGYQSVDCPFCHGHGTKNWTRKFNNKKIKNYLKRFNPKVLQHQTIVVPELSYRSNLRYYVDDELNILKKSRFRSVFGREMIPSNNFVISKIDDEGITINGSGFGHGVGLCQFGAYAMAKKGMTYKKILAHYFPNHKIEKIYE